MLVIKITDFVGFFEISTTNKTETILLEYINIFEERILKQLLGNDLALLFIADLVDGIPQTEKFTDIFNSLPCAGCADDVNIISNGIKYILTGMIFYHYSIDRQTLNTQSGVARLEVEASKVLSYDNSARFAEVRFNSALESYLAVQTFIKTNSGNYPEFKGVELKVKFGSLGI